MTRRTQVENLALVLAEYPATHWHAIREPDGYWRIFYLMAGRTEPAVHVWLYQFSGMGYSAKWFSTTGQKALRFTKATILDAFRADGCTVEVLARDEKAEPILLSARLP